MPAVHPSRLLEKSPLHLNQTGVEATCETAPAIRQNLCAKALVAGSCYPVAVRISPRAKMAPLGGRQRALMISRITVALRA